MALGHAERMAILKGLALLMVPPSPMAAAG